MNLWIDDVRPAPDGWTWVKNYDDAVSAFKAGSVVCASFDHDLGFLLDAKDEGDWDYAYLPGHDYDHTAKTGYDLIRWVWENDAWPEVSCAVHSMNPVGHANICGTIERYGPYTHREPVIYDNGKAQLHGVCYSKENNAS